MVISKGATFRIDERFTIHVATGKDDEFEEILKFNISIHHEPVRDYLSRIYLEHPRRATFFWLYVKDVKSNQIVSSIGLMPLEWRVGPLTIPVCEMGFVGTAEAYRKEGFIRKLNKIYEQIMTEKGFLLSVIRGIPYFYRKLGYEFVLPLDNRFLLPKSKIPQENISSTKIRRSTIEDLNFIEKTYEEFNQNFLVWNLYSKDSFIFKYNNSEITDFQEKTYIIEENGTPEAYLMLGMTYDKLGYKIRSSRLTRSQWIKLLQFIKDLHKKSDELEIDFDVQEDPIFKKLIIELGGIKYNDYGWQVKIPDVEAFFNKIKPLLEERVRNSEFKNLTRAVTLSNYQRTFEINFKEGRITDIKSIKEYPGEFNCDVQIPGSMLYKLILGENTFEEINYIIKDAMIKYTSKKLISALFPKESSYPETYY
ncbi:MAG: GNAT family N-acetyltransferase [Candidatus Lokiarchaeota archaeon]|nr:GNAT family N-acetyltransferase [Candidatus Lokiarchaeota archaeon]